MATQFKTEQWLQDRASSTAGITYHYYGNLGIDSITRNSNNIVVTGKIRLTFKAPQGYGAWYDWGLTAVPTGGSEVTVLSNGQRQTANSSGVCDTDVSFTSTISVAPSDTSATISVRYRAWSNKTHTTTYWDKTVSWNVDFPISVQKPSGLGCTVNSVAWNKVNGTFSVGNWGGEPTGSQKYIAGRLFSASSNARREEQATNTNSITRDITTSSTPLEGGIDVKGAGSYRIDTYASNSAGSATTSMQNVYTPPAPLQTLSYSQTQQSTNVKVDVSIAGGNSTNNYGNTVTTYWRYSTNGGSSWSGWGNAGTGTPWTAKTASFTCNYGASVKIQAKQTYQSKDSAVKEVSFTATNGTAPSGGTVTITDSTWNTVTLQASGINYGKPDGISSRYSIVGVSNTTSPYSYKREKNLGAVTSGAGTVDNNSPSGGSAQPFTLKGMIPVYAYLWVENTVQSAFVANVTTPYYLPPAPGQLSYTLDSETVTHKDYTVSYVGVAANNVTGYTAADLKRTVRYSEDNGSTWTYVDNDVQKSLTTVTSFQISIAAQHNVIVQSWLSYKGKNSDVSAVVIANNADPIYFYGGVSERDPVTQEWGDPVAKKIVKMYGSVNDESVKIVKLYGSVNGVAREFFEDV